MCTNLSLGVIEVSRNSDDSVLHITAEVGLGSLLHLDQDHGAHLLGSEPLVLVLVIHLELGSAALIHHVEGPVLQVGLDAAVVILAADQSLGIKDGVGGVDCDLTKE